jgi:hypothetical protein
MGAAMVLKRVTLRTRVWSCRCERCGHRWVSRQKKPPRACAGCSQVNWNSKARAYRRRARAAR